MRSFDSETTGIDLYHAARPFFVTTCDMEQNQIYFEWDVDPETRRVIIPQEDIDEIEELIHESEHLVLQNTKFDATALSAIGIDDWPWERTFDTLLSAHILTSNQPKDLTTQALVYLRINIKPYEDALAEATKEARKIARSKYKTWKIAKEGIPGFPSIKKSSGPKKKKSGVKKEEEKDSNWKNDTWLPRAIAKEEGFPPDHPWWTVLSEYGNADSSVTLPIFLKHRKLLEDRDLWQIYLERLKVLPIAHDMEQRGVSLSQTRLEERRKEYKKQVQEHRKLCINIASTYDDFELELSEKGANNNSLKEFVFDVAKLDVAVLTDKGAPSLDKNAIDHYLATLPERSKMRKFVQSLRAVRQGGTAITYMDNYERFAQKYIPY